MSPELTNIELVRKLQQIEVDMQDYKAVPLHHIEQVSRGSEGRLFDSVLKFAYGVPHNKLYDSQIWTCGWEHGGIDVSDYLFYLWAGLICQYPICLNVHANEENDSLGFTLGYSRLSTMRIMAYNEAISDSS